MRKILTKLLIIIWIIWFISINNLSITYAEWEASSWIKIEVTEKIPWANCSPKWTAKEWETQMYECNVEKWFWAVTVMLGRMIKYFTYIAALAWVLYIIINGIIYSMWWADESFKDESKKRIVATLTWLVLLFLSWIILNLIAPWIYK